MIAALLYAGSEAAIDDVDACRFYGVRAAAVDDEVVHVVVPADSRVRTKGFVVVRRTSAPYRVTATELLRYVDAADAVMAAARRHRSGRQVLALLSDAVQRRAVTHQELMEAHVRGARRNLRALDDALEQVGAGVRSLPEGDFRRLAEASALLPPLLYNRRLRLPDRRTIRPDALAVDAGLVHETNGRRPHRRDDLFEDMQVRHDTMTVAGLTVPHNSPRRIGLRGREVIAEFERCYIRLAGRGLPPGVELLPEDE